MLGGVVILLSFLWMSAETRWVSVSLGVIAPSAVAQEGTHRAQLLRPSRLRRSSGNTRSGCCPVFLFRCRIDRHHSSGGFHVRRTGSRCRGARRRRNTVLP